VVASWYGGGRTGSATGRRYVMISRCRTADMSKSSQPTVAAVKGNSACTFCAHINIISHHRKTDHADSQILVIGQEG